MKRYLLIAALAALALSACQRPEKQAAAVAETFLHAYYTADYAAAAAVCTPRLAEQVLRGADAADGTDEGASALVRERTQTMKEALSQTSFRIVSVEVDEDAASARVRFDLFVPDLEYPVQMALTLQLEGRTAQVDRIE